MYPLGVGGRSKEKEETATTFCTGTPPGTWYRYLVLRDRQARHRTSYVCGGARNLHTTRLIHFYFLYSLKKWHFTFRASFTHSKGRCSFLPSFFFLDHWSSIIILPLHFASLFNTGLTFIHPKELIVASIRYIIRCLHQLHFEEGTSRLEGKCRAIKRYAKKLSWLASLQFLFCVYSSSLCNLFRPRNVPYYHHHHHRYQ